MFRMPIERMPIEKSFQKAVSLNDLKLLEYVLKQSPNLLLFGILHPIHYVAIHGSPETLLFLLEREVDPLQTFDFKMGDNEEVLDALDLALMYGKIENAECLFNCVREFQSNEALSVCYYHVITKACVPHQIAALNWLLQKSRNPNIGHSDDDYRPVHTAIQLKKQGALLRLLQDDRFDLCLIGNYHEPHGGLTPFQLALLYNNEEAAISLTQRCNLMDLLDAKSSEGINATKFAEKIGKKNILDQWIQKLSLLQSFNQMNLCATSGLLRLSNSDLNEMECESPSFGCH